MHRRAAICFTALAALATGCVHTARLDRAGCEVDFHGLRLNGAPVEDRTLTVQGHPYILETSQFGYEIEPPFQGLQVLISLSSADPDAPLAATPENLQAALDGFTSALPNALPGTRCEPPIPDASFGPGGLEQRCQVSAEGVRYHLRMRAVPGPRGLLLQMASWITEKGKGWSDAFWSSLRALPQPPLPAGVAPVQPPESKALAMKVAQVLFPSRGQSRVPTSK